MPLSILPPSNETIRLVANAAKDGATTAAKAHCPPEHVNPTVGLALAVSAVERATTVMTLDEFQAFITEIWNSPTHMPS